MKGKTTQINLVGITFGNLIVINGIKTERRFFSSWLCRCQLCGKERNFYSSDLLGNHNISCGSCGFHASRIHGLHNTKFYKKWESMVRRCNDKKADSYSRYGKRGINVCDRWLDIINFKADMYESYLSHVNIHGTVNSTLERVDNNKGYTPENCRWATCAEQSRNTSKNIWVEYNGRKMIMPDWAKEVNLDVDTLYRRKKKGMTDEQILFWPKGKHY